MHHNYGSEKILNCNPGGVWSSSYQQDPNVNSWLDYNYNYNASHAQNVDYILNFEEHHNNAQTQYYQQQQTHITELNYDMPVRYDESPRNNVTNHESYNLIQFASSLDATTTKPHAESPQTPSTASIPTTTVLSPASKSDSSEKEVTSYSKNHIHAEKKRRQNIKQGFDTLRSLISSDSGTKISNARLLYKTYDHIKHLKNQKVINEQKIKSLKLELAALNESISSIQEALPMTGASMEIDRPSTASSRYEAYLKEKTRQNWKFWIFAKIFNPVVQAIITENHETLDWVDAKCPIIQLRTATFDMLREVSLNTELLTESSSRLDQEIGKLIDSR